MDEKTATTVQFLRARLLSERIVSKTARQRAEMLAQRVVELEEQLRIMNIQRKNAEKAAEEVLSVLETRGIIISGLTDSSPDREDNKCSNQQRNHRIECNNVTKDEFLATSKMDENEVHDDLPCLSWKGHGSSLDSQEKKKTKQNRHYKQKSCFITAKSSQRRLGKSCWKKKGGDIGSTSEIELQKPALIDAHGNEVFENPDEFDEKHECPLEASKDIDEKDDMERALEEQAQLITQFQAMENAQREWEENFNENEMSMLGNSLPCNPVNIVENCKCSDKCDLVEWIPQHENDEKISIKDISFTEDKKVGSDIFLTPGLSAPPCESTAINGIETASKSLTFPPNNSPDSARKAHIKPVFAKSNTGSEVIERNSQLSRATNSSSGCVLQSLRQARNSLRQEIAKMPSSTQSFSSVVSPANSPIMCTTSCKALFDLPVESSALFQLPSDSFPDSLTKTNIYGSQLRLTASHPYFGLTSPVTSLISNDHGYHSYLSRGGQLLNNYANHHSAKYVEYDSPISTVQDNFDRRSSSSVSVSLQCEHDLHRSGLSTKRHLKPLLDLRSQMPRGNGYIYDNKSPLSSLKSRTLYGDGYFRGKNVASDSH